MYSMLNEKHDGKNEEEKIGNLRFDMNTTEQECVGTRPTHS